MAQIERFPASPVNCAPGQVLSSAESAPEIAEGSAAVSQEDFEAFRAGDAQAFQVIVETCQRRVMGFVRLFGISREEAEEVAQDAFVKLYAKRRKIDGPDKVLPWMFVTARRMAIRRSRKTRRRGELSLSDEAVCSLVRALPPGQVDDAQREMTSTLIGTVLNELKPRDREIILLRFYGGLQIREIADVMRMPLGSVGVTLRRALDKAAAELERRGISQEDLL